MIIDTHTHIYDEKLQAHIPEIVGGMQASGLEGIVVVGFDRASSALSVELAENNDNIYAVVGTHPHEAQLFEDEHLQYYRQVATHEKVIAIGEIGLDYFYDLSPREIQREVFIRQLQLADELKLPVVLHIRDAYGEALEILTANKKLLNSGILMHCYQGSAEMIRQFNDFGCYYAFGGVVTFKNAKKADVIKAVPRDKILFETDCPYMTPEPFRGRANEPKYINFVVDKVAEILGEDRQVLIDQTSENARRLFVKMR